MYVDTNELRNCMRQHNITYRDMANSILVCQHTIGNWVNGKTEIPLWGALRIAKHIGKPVESLFKENGKA